MSRSFELLAIDGGGTKTRAVLVDAEGNILGEGRAGASNYHVTGAEEAEKSLKSAIEAAFQAAGLPAGDTLAVKKAVFALAGIDTSQDESEVAKIVTQVIKGLSLEIDTIIVENDCLSALLGATRNKAGILLIAGTGSIVFGHDGNGTTVRCGGWGHRAGDEGSGFWIGKQAIQAVFKSYDGRGEETKLSQLILEKLNLTSAEELCNWMYSEAYSVDDVAALAAEVEKGYQLGDKVSKWILDEAAEELVLMAKKAIQRTGIPMKPFDIILQGGVLEHNLYIKNQLVQWFQQSYPKVKVVASNEEPLQHIIKRGLSIR